MANAQPYILSANNHKMIAVAVKQFDALKRYQITQPIPQFA
jgi:hypothetical protein